MKTYSEFRPTQFDVAGLGCNERQDWLVAPCATNRDAGTLQQSNWRVMVAELGKLDPNGHDHEEHRFGHWANGYFDLVLVRPGTECESFCESVENALADYPILDESDWSELQLETASALWEISSLRERVEYCQRARCSIFAARRDSVPEKVFNRWCDDDFC